MNATRLAVMLAAGAVIGLFAWRFGEAAGRRSADPPPPAPSTATWARDDATRQQLLADTLDALDRSWRVRGSWPEEIAQLNAALELAGALDPRPGQPCAVLDHPEAARLRRALIELACAEASAGTLDPRVPAALAKCQDPAWPALGRAIAGAAVEADGLVATTSPDLELALAQPITAELALACLVPDARLADTARALAEADPGAFWPRVCLAREAAARSDWPEVRLHALVALGRESASVWPRLALGYAALADQDWGGLLAQATYASAARPEDPRSGLMQAIALAQLGRRDEAVAHLGSLPRGTQSQPLIKAALAAGLPIDDAALQPGH